MLFEEELLPIKKKFIVATTLSERNDAISRFFPMQRSDFEGLLLSNYGYPVINRLLDPPLHEFMPSATDLMMDLTDLKLRMQHLSNLKDLDSTLEEIEEKRLLLQRVTALEESNPMLGTRGVRLGINIRGLYSMHVQAIFVAAFRVAEYGDDVRPEVMIPLV